VQPLAFPREKRFSRNYGPNRWTFPVALTLWGPRPWFPIWVRPDFPALSLGSRQRTANDVFILVSLERHGEKTVSREREEKNEQRALCLASSLLRKLCREISRLHESRGVGLRYARCVLLRCSRSVRRSRARCVMWRMCHVSSDVVAKHLACTESTALDSLAQPQLLAP